MRLIVGLGNPDPEYQWTPHNLGFMAVDELADRGSIRVERPEGKALVAVENWPDEEVLLAKPQTYMNLSGVSIRELLAKYELEPADLLVMWDEVQLPSGTFKIRPDGSAGSHNGAKSVIGSIGTQRVRKVAARLRSGSSGCSLRDYVLRPMKERGAGSRREMLGQVGDAVEVILPQGMDAAMTQVQPPQAARSQKTQSS